MRATSKKCGLATVVAAVTTFWCTTFAGADSSVTMTDIRHFSTIYGADGSSHGVAVIVVSDADDNEIDTFCVDIDTPISIDDGVVEVTGPASDPGLTDQQWSQVRSVLANAHSVMTGNDVQRTAAIQAALWNVSSGFELETDPAAVPANDPVVIANYQAILAALPGWSSPGINPTLQLTGPTTATEATTVGPFIAQGLDGGVPLNVQVTGPATPVDADGDLITETLVGTPFFLQIEGPGDLTITIDGPVLVPAGTIYDAPGVQTIAVATTGLVLAHANLELTATATTTTTSTSTTSTTSTTVAATTTTTVAPLASGTRTTNAEAAAAGTSRTRELPATGHNDNLTTLAGIGLISLGTAATIGARKLRTNAH
ncbi:MAG: thioester domain-containing protein [Acidimicrobiia bacterium]